MKENLTKVKEKFNLENILCLYIVIQPIIDMLTSVCVRNISPKLSLGILVRMIFMVFIVIYALVKADKKDRIKILIYYILIAISIIVSSIISFKNYGTERIFTQAKGVVKIYYFPVVLVSLMAIFKQKEIKPKIKYLNIATLIYGIVIILGVILDFGYTTYSDKNFSGTIGLFYAGNEIGAILSILMPFIFITFYSKEFKIYNIISAILITYAILQIGTKTAFISAIGLLTLTTIIMVVKLFTKERKNIYKYFISSLAIITTICLCINYIPAVKNLKNKVTEIQAETKEPSKIEQEPETPLSEETKEENKSKSKTIINNILSNRDVLYENALEKYKSASLVSKIFGLGFVDRDVEEGIIERKMVEMDYCDIFFCLGIFGTIIYIVPFVIIVWIICKKFFKHFKQNVIDAKVLLNLYSILMGLAIALVAGHVFTAPAVSIFMIFSMFELLSLLKSKEEVYEK